MQDRTYGSTPAATHDEIEAPSSSGLADPGLATAFLQHTSATAGLTPDAVAVGLQRQRDPYLRHAVLTEIGARWGGDGVRALLAAEQQLSPVPNSVATPTAVASNATEAAAREPIDAGTGDPSRPWPRTSMATPPMSNVACAAAAPECAAAAPECVEFEATAAAESAVSSTQQRSTQQRSTQQRSTQQHHSALDRALALAELGQAHLAAIQTELVPAYRRAVAAIDTSAVKALALQIVGGVARIIDAQSHVVRLVPQADTGPRAVMASTAETDPGAPDAAHLAKLTAAKATLDAAVIATVPKLAVQVSPQWFGDELVAGHAAAPPPHVREVLVQLTYEAGLVVQLLEEADTIGALLAPIDKVHGASEPATEGTLRAAVDRLERWKGRPINFLFLSRVLTKRGLWQSMQGIQDARGHTAAELERKVIVQSKETGTTADVGEAWDAEEAHRLLSHSRFDWKITDAEAASVFEMLAKAEPRARGELVKQLYRMGRLGPLCEHLPWGQVKELWESIADPEASKLLEPYWADKGGGMSLGKRLEAQDHWYATALSRFLDIATFGAKPRIDAAYDAREAGMITDGGYWGGVTKAVGRAAFVAAAAAATGGVAGEFVTGASEGMGLMAGRGVTGMLARGVTTVASGVTAGGFGNTAGHLIGDVYDQVLDGKEGFDSASSYRRSFVEGAAMGGAAAAVGLAASKYLQAGTRSLAQEAVVARPHLTSVFEAVRSAGVGAGVKLQTTVRDFLDMLGGPPAFRFAYAGNPAIPARLSSAPPTAPMWIVVRPLKDLNAPMKMEGGERDGAVGEIVTVEPSDEIAAMFDEYSSPGRYRDVSSSRQPGSEDDVSEFDDGYQIKSPRVQDPKRPTWQESERRVSDELNPTDFNDQRSFVDGKEVSRGTRGSTRPDNYSDKLRLSVDVKNYEIETIEGQTRLVKNVTRQLSQRAANLPKGSRQGLVIDARGQTVTANQMAALRARIVRMSNGLIDLDDIVFIME